eukprot:1161592-Pelagomonas_calceolata.AAC.12
MSIAVSRGACMYVLIWPIGCLLLVQMERRGDHARVWFLVCFGRCAYTFAQAWRSCWETGSASPLICCQCLTSIAACKRIEVY